MDLSEVLLRMPEVSRVLRAVVEVPDPDPAQARSVPHLAAIGPLAASTDHTLVRLSDLPIWDVNGYYRALRLTPAHTLTKGELRRAYQTVGGQRDEFATYAFKRLLDPVFRAFYNRRALGDPVDDLYRWQEVSRRSALWASVQTLRTGTLHRAEDFIPAEIRDRIAEDIRAEEHVPGKVSLSATNEAGWEYGYYLWDTRHRDDAALAAWQQALIQAFWERGLRTRFAVGYFERTSHAEAVRYRLENPDVEAILLRAERPPDLALARVVVASYQTHPQITFAEPLFLDTEPEQNPPIQAHTEQGDPMADTEMLEFATGAAEAEDYIKARAEARKAARGGANYFSLKDDGDHAALRFLIPDTKWIYVNQHDFIPTKGAPADKPTEREWPKNVGAVCRYSPIGADKHPAYDECFICDTLKDEKGRRQVPTTKVWTLAAGRLVVVDPEEIRKLIDEGRVHPSQADAKRVIVDEAELVEEVDDNGNPTGKKIWRKKIYIVNQSVRNFFSPLTTIAGMLRSMGGSITDRDFLIVRKGEARSNKVDYEAVDLGPFDVTVYKEGSETETEVIRYDTQDPRIARLYEGHGTDEQALRRLINRRISKEYYNFYFDPRVSVAWKDYFASNEDEQTGKTADTTAASPSEAQQAGQVATAEPTSGVSKEKLDALRAQVMASTGQSTGPAASVNAAPLPTS